jgi:hypothetical protein
MKKLCALSLGFIFLLSGCSSAPSAADKAKEEQIALLKENVCKVTKATGKDTVNGQDVSDVLNNGVIPSDLNDPADADFWAAVKKRDEDANKLRELVGEWINPVDGTGWLKFCNS